MRLLQISAAAMLLAALPILSGCGSSSASRSAADAAARLDQVRVAAPDIGNAAFACPDPGVDPDPKVATVENRAYAKCSDGKRGRAVSGVAAWEREFSR